MHHQPATAVFFQPGEIVMIFNIQQNPGPQMRRNRPMDQFMIGRGVSAHQFHGRKVLPSVGAIQRKPGERRQLLGKLRVLPLSQAAVVLGHLSPHAPAAAMA